MFACQHETHDKDVHICTCPRMLCVYVYIYIYTEGKGDDRHFLRKRVALPHEPVALRPFGVMRSPCYAQWMCWVPKIFLHAYNICIQSRCKALAKSLSSLRKHMHVQCIYYMCVYAYIYIYMYILCYVCVCVSPKLAPLGLLGLLFTDSNYRKFVRPSSFRARKKITHKP